MAAMACRADRAMFLRKWVGFVSAMWLTIFSGCYTFANYSTALKEVLGINQKLLNGIGIAKDVGDSCVGMIAGFVSNYLPVWALLSISACLGFLGYGVEWLVVSQTINPLPYWVIFIASTTSGSSVCWMNVAIFNASVRNFKRNRGPVSGLFKACMGLSAAVFFTLCDALFSNSASIYLIMLITIPTAFCLVSAIFFHPVPSAETVEEEQVEHTSLVIFNTMASGLAMFIAVVSFLPSGLKESLLYKVVDISVVVGILGGLGFVPFVLLFRMNKSKNHEDTKEGIFAEENNQPEVVCFHEKIEVNDDCEISHSLHDGNLYEKKVVNDKGSNGLDQPLLESNGNVYTTGTSLNRHGLARWWCCNRLPSLSFWSVQDLGEDKPTLSLFKTWHYYLLYFSLFCGCGSGIAFTNNLGQVGQSLGFDSISLFASLFSLGNFFGRLASGNVSEHFLRSKAMPRPVWMGLTKIPMIVLFAWLSTGSMASLYVGSLVIGFCHGSLVTLTIPIVSEFYGLRHFGTNYMVTSTYFLTGSYAFSSMAGYLYDIQVMPGEESSSLTCYGAKCYGTTFQILASCLIIAVVCDTLLTVISRPLYQKLHLVTKS